MEGSPDMSEPLLPEWFAHVPMNVPEQTLVSIGETGKAVSAQVLMNALGVKVGSAVGAFAMRPDVAQAVAEQTGNSNWKNLAAEPTLVTRTHEDAWDIMVGEEHVTLGREAIIAALARALQESIEHDA